MDRESLDGGDRSVRSDCPIQVEADIRQPIGPERGHGQDFHGPPAVAVENAVISSQAEDAALWNRIANYEARTWHDLTRHSKLRVPSVNLCIGRRTWIQIIKRYRQLGQRKPDYLVLHNP